MNVSFYENLVYIVKIIVTNNYFNKAIFSNQNSVKLKLQYRNLSPLSLFTFHKERTVIIFKNMYKVNLKIFENKLKLNILEKVMLEEKKLNFLL